MRCWFGHREFHSWCPYCPKGEERRRIFFEDALRAVRRRLRR